MSDRKESIIHFIQESRHSLYAILNRLQPDQWETVIQAEDQHWTARQMLAHMVSAQRGMTTQITQIKAGGEGAPADFDLNRWNNRMIERSANKTVAELRAELDQGHMTLQETITALDLDDLDKRGRHGSLQIMSIEEIARLIGDHEVMHGKLIAEKLDLK